MPGMNTLEKSAHLGVERSLSGRAWRQKPYDEALARRFVQTLGVPQALAQIMAARGLDEAQGAAFLKPTFREFFPDPSSFADMDQAVQVILDAMAAGQAISIFADYDVDGATSSALLRRWFRAMGQEAGLYVPDRLREGYGPNIGAFKALKAQGVQLVITVDCGAVSHEPLAAARDMGLSVIVIDHHLMPEDAPLPPTAALVNPNRPDDTSGQGMLAAAGVCYVLMAALNREARRRGLFAGQAEPDLISLAGIAALGTVCDVASLTGFNRALVRQGLQVMSRLDIPGLAALASVASAAPPFGTYHAGFVLGPRINAGGRVGEADLGARLLASDDADECTAIAEALDGFNTERRDIEQAVQEAAIKMVEAENLDDPVIVVAGKGWHPGVIGIVAGRLKERFGKPAIVIGLDAKTGEGKGSGRSVSGVNLGAAIGEAVRAGVIKKGGGHAMAAGLCLSAEQVTPLRDFLIETIGEPSRRAAAGRSLKLDALMSARGADVHLLEEIEQAAPFGMGNPEPVFGFANMRVCWAQEVNGGHVRCALEDACGGGQIKAIAFRARDQGLAEALLARDNDLLHVAGKLKLDTYRGRTSVDLRIEDVALADPDGSSAP